jgi:hypothetical protein
MATNPQGEIEDEIKDIVAKQQELATLEQQLSQNEQFRNFMQLKKTVDEQATLFWSSVESQMIQHDIKSIKGDWGSVTITERIGFDIDDDLLPNKYFKKVPNTKLIADTFKLEGKPVKGTSPKYTKYLTKRIK